MKKIVVFGVAAMFLVACSNEAEHVQSGEENVVSEATETAVVYEIDTENSEIEWTGTKHLGKVHHGYINLVAGSLAVEEGAVQAGDFVADMSSIVNIDLPEEGEYNKSMLEDHLKSPDFFNVEEYPESTFHITSIEEVEGEDGSTHAVSGNLTIKGIAKEITFPATIEANDEGVSLNANFHINRLDWNVNFDKDQVESFLEGLLKKGKDDFVKDEIGLNIKLVGNKA